MAEETSKTTHGDPSEPGMQTIILVAGTEAPAEKGETSKQDRLLDLRPDLP
jgi:hypothetical protein